MWFLSSIADKLEEWIYPVDERLDCYLARGRSNVEINIFPRGTKSNDHLLMQVRDNKAESQKKHCIALTLLLSELLNLTELRMTIIWFIVGPERGVFQKLIDTNLALIKYTEMTNNPYLASLWKSYIIYTKSMVMYPSIEHRPPIGSEHDSDEHESLAIATKLVVPLLFSLPSVTIKLFGHSYTGNCFGVIVDAINRITNYGPIDLTHSHEALELSNGNRVVVLNFDTYDEFTMSLVQ